MSVRIDGFSWLLANRITANIHSQELSAFRPSDRVESRGCRGRADLAHALSWVAIGRHSILCLVVVSQARDAIQD